MLLLLRQRLRPSSGLEAAIAEKVSEVAILKYIPKKGKSAAVVAMAAGAAAEEESSPPLMGFCAALSERSRAMEARGMATSMPVLSEEEKKAEKEKKKALASAKHRLKW